MIQAFGVSDKEISIRRQSAQQAADHLNFGFRLEVNQNIAAENHVEGDGARGRWFLKQVEMLEANCPLDFESRFHLAFTLARTPQHK